MGAIQKTAIIIPCYNESKRIRVNEFLSFANGNPDISFIFVNDSSTDNTEKHLKYLREAAPKQILYLNLKKNQGKAEAVRQGFIVAIDMGFKNIGYWDADLSTPLYFINKFCKLLNLQTTLIVMGSRVKMLGYKIERQQIRHYLGRIFATFASIVLNMPVYDTQCGAKIFKNESYLKKIFFKSFSTKWIFDVEILARFKTLQIDNRFGTVEDLIVEYPLEKWNQTQGSKLKLLDFFFAAIDLIKIYFHFKFYKKLRELLNLIIYFLR